MLRSSFGVKTFHVCGDLGSPVAMVTGYATRAYASTFDPCGTAVLIAGGTGNGVRENPFLFKGGIQDRATGWIHYGNRWYNTTLGRWTQQDTLDAPLDPGNANRYAYAGADPISNVDPTGRFYDDGWNWGQSAVVAGATGVAEGLVGCGIGGVVGAGACSGPGCVIGGLTGFITGVVTGFVGDAVGQAF